MRILLIFLIFSFNAFSQDISHHLGNEKSPHILLQMNTQSESRSYIIGQLYDFFNKRKKGKNIFSSDVELSNSRVPVVLALESMEEGVSKALGRSLLINLGNASGSVSQQDRQDYSRGKLDISNRKDFLNRMVLNIQLNKLTYTINPYKMDFTEFSTSLNDSKKQLDIKARFDIKGITAKAKDICINFDTFYEEAGKIKVSKSNYNCLEAREVLETDLDKLYQRLEGIIPESIVRETNYPKFLNNLGAEVKNVALNIKDQSPLRLGVDLTLKETPEGIKLRIVDGSVDSLVNDLKMHFKDSFDINLENASVKVNGFSGMVVQAVPVAFTDTAILKALAEREKELVELIMKPIEDSIEEIIEEAQADPNSVMSKDILMASRLKFKGVPELGLSVDQLTFRGERKDNRFIGAGINVDFGIEKNSFGIGYSRIQDQLSEYLGKEEEGKNGDMVISISDEFFNDAIQFALKNYSEELKKIDFDIKDLQFNIFEGSGFQGSNQLLKENSAYFSGCVRFKPKKNILLKLVNGIVGGKNGIGVPLMIYTDINLKSNSEGVPEFTIDLKLEASREHFLSQEKDCPFTKRFKKMASRIARKQAELRFNQYEGIPFLKVALVPLKGLQSSPAEIIFDKENGRMNIVLSFNKVKSIRDDIVEKFSDVNQKVSVTFPKLDEIKKYKTLSRREKRAMKKKVKEKLSTN